MSSTAVAAARELCVRIATPEDRHRIYRLRHEVYAQELGQHVCNSARELRDPLDDFNEYLVVTSDDELCGFVSITPPGHGVYSLDKYLPRADWPFPIDDGLYEMRLLTVTRSHRSGPFAALLMHASQRYLQMQSATRVMAIGRREVLHLYEKIGFNRLGNTFQSGSVQYELMARVMAEIAPHVTRFEPLLRRWEPSVQWELDCDFLPASPKAANGCVTELVAADRQPEICYHGGAFFEAIGDGFETLERRLDIINADVLDAWFPPAPGVLSAVSEHLDWILRTSPPTQCEGLVREIAKARGVEESNIVPGAGSSDLIFRAMLRWLKPGARVLLLDPTYGEYRHLFQHVIPCKVDYLHQSPDDDFAIDLDRLAACLRQDYDVIVLVNPNNPTGVHVDRADLDRVLRSAGSGTRVWVDEAYIDYVSSEESLEQFAAASSNVIVCKSMSKAYALSGARVGYLCGPPQLMSALRTITPPWVVSLPAQIAAVHAVRDPEYYRCRYAETRTLRSALAGELRSLGLTVWPGAANFLLCQLPEHVLSVSTLLERCREQRLFLRDVSTMMSRPELGTGLFRVAVKDADTNRRIVDIIRS